jgi:hypothetical protein
MTPATPATLFEPRADRLAIIAKLLAARRHGATLRQAAAAAGVHVSTICRWQLRSPELAAALRAIAVQAAERDAQQHRAAPQPRRVDPFSVPYHPLCPRCGAPAGIGRTTSGRLYFWQCGHWPAYPWRSWRPRYPHDCPACGGPRFWSHSRRSVRCLHCGAREPAAASDAATC